MERIEITQREQAELTKEMVYDKFIRKEYNCKKIRIGVKNDRFEAMLCYNVDNITQLWLDGDLDYILEGCY